MMSRIISEVDLEGLRALISDKMSEYRYTHTLGVERAAVKLGMIFLPESVNELRAAALLHDIAKEMDISLQLDYIDGCDRLDKKQRCPEQALHSFSAVAVICKDYSDYATDNILEAVKNHTLGDPEMSLFARIIFLSDYIEEGRSYFDSVRIRKALYAVLDSTCEYGEKLRAFHRAIVDAIDCTVKSVSSRGYLVDQRTLKTKKAMEALI